MKYIALFGLILFSIFNFFGCKPIENQDIFGMHFTRPIRSVTIPFRTSNNLIIIPMRINDSDTMNFILDTGVRTTLLTDLKYGRKLSLKFAGTHLIQGHGKGKNLEAHHAYDNTFRIGHYVVGKHLNLLVLSEDVFFLSSKLGIEINGLIGADLFESFIVEIDYQKQKLILHNPKHYKYRKKYHVLPMTLEKGKPYICAEMTDTQGNEAYIKLLVDTGASHSLLLERNKQQNIIVPNHVIEAYLGRGLVGNIWGQIGRVNSLKLAGYELENIDTAYPDSLSLVGIKGIANRNGNLGANILKRFKLVFDYRNEKLLLHPSSYFKEPFYHNLSGMEVSAPIPELRYYIISEIIPNMPAHQAGLQKGDEILSINGKSVISYQLGEITLLLQSKPGRKINLKVRRNGKIIKTGFKLTLLL